MSSRVRSFFGRFRRGHPDIYEAAREYAKAKGIDVEDVTGAALSAYLSSDQEGKEALESAIEERRAKGGGSSMAGMKEALAMFESMVDTSVKLMTKSQEAGQTLIKGSLLNELKNQAETVEAIRSIGATSGKGSLEDTLATAFINRILSGAGVNIQASTKTPAKQSGTGKIEKTTEA